MSNKKNNKKTRRIIITIILIILVLLTIDLMLLVNRPELFRASPNDPNDIRYEALQRSKQQESITYEVFKPAIDPYNNLVDYFRPSVLKENIFSRRAFKTIGCGFLPSNPNRIPFKWLMNLGRGCY
jgi:flagellar basal body-associated protein FliL